jgi:hypothetical protein
MDKSTQLKRVVCGVALVSLSTIRAASAQAPPGSGCAFPSGGGSGTFTACVDFTPGPQTQRVDFPGHHSFKIIVNVQQPFSLLIVATTLSPPGPQTRYPDNSPLPPESCIPYVFATSDTTPTGGLCALYTVTAFGANRVVIPPDQESSYFSGKIIYRIAWDHPTLTSPDFDNPRALRADDALSPFFDVTDGIFPFLQSGQDPAVDSSADGFSQYIVVQQPHGNGLAGCLAPLNCGDPNNPNANVFNAGSTVPVKIVLNPPNPAADIRLTFTGPDGVPHLAEASGKSNIANQFRATGGRFEFNWSTKGLAPGVYALTIAPGTSSGSLFAPTTIMVTLQ